MVRVKRLQALDPVGPAKEFSYNSRLFFDFIRPRVRIAPAHINQKTQDKTWGSLIGAGEETLTLDLILGKDAL